MRSNAADLGDGGGVPAGEAKHRHSPVEGERHRQHRDSDPETVDEREQTTPGRGPAGQAEGKHRAQRGADAGASSQVRKAPRLEARWPPRPWAAAVA